MENIKLASKFRDSSGKEAARKMRVDGEVPAVIYGHSDDTIPITVSERELRRVLTGNWETTVLEMNIAGKISKECSAIIKDVQQHPATGRILHVDFQYIRKGEKIRIVVPLHLAGEPKGVKEQGGVLEHGSRELNVRVFPRHIPDHIEIDVSDLEIHDAIHIRELVEKHPDLEFLDDEDVTLAIVLPPRVEAAPAEGEEEELAEGEEEPEVIAKGKEEKEGEGGGEASS